MDSSENPKRQANKALVPAIASSADQASSSEVNRIAAKAKREACRSQLLRLLSAYHPTLSTCPICQRAFRARIGLAGHLRTQCAINPAKSTPSTTLAPGINPAPTTTRVTADHTVAAPPPPSALPQPLHRPQRPVSLPPRLNALPPPMRRRPTSYQLQTSPTSPPPGMWIRFIPVLIAFAPSPHTVAWPVTCESIAQRLANQCLEHQPTPAAFGSTVHSSLAHSCISWTSSDICTSTKTCGKQPQDASHHHNLPNHHLTAHQSHPPQTPNRHLPRKWEACVSVLSLWDPPASCVIGVQDCHGSSSAVARKEAD
nr:unnamed protein product [Spirometra erinaceieuropaei]